MEGKLMEVESSYASNNYLHSAKESKLVPVPVVASGIYGEGLPYAPEDWPHPGDKWRWKVGNRKLISGYWRDRYLYPPSSCPRPRDSKSGFPSRLSVKEYLNEEFPTMDVDSFFSMFIWKIPCGNHIPKAAPESLADLQILGANEHKESELGARETRNCRAGNTSCNQQAKIENDPRPAKDCDICCSEVGFCRDCCCILCSKAVEPAYEGYSFIRCEAVLEDNYICGHVAHVECALRSLMAGTVGGTINLDVEYYCRRCDNRTTLISHVSKLLKVCESVDSRDDVEKILSLAVCILRGSEQTEAKILQSRIGLAMAKLKRGVQLGKIWEVEDKNAAIISESRSNELVVLDANESPSEITVNCINGSETIDAKGQRPDYIADYDSTTANLEDEIDQILRVLRTEQESEYNIAEEKLYRQKDLILSLYRQLDHERSELSNPQTLLKDGTCDAPLSNVVHRVDQIKLEEEKLASMIKVAREYGRHPKSIFKQFF